MNAKDLSDAYSKNKEEFHKYINDIKQKSNLDIYTIVNPTLIKNPYTSYFPKRFFLNISNVPNKFSAFIVNTIKYYMKNLYFFVSYLISFFIYKIYYKKNRNSKTTVIIDVFLLVDKIINENEFNESYFNGIYDVFEKYDIEYAILPRLYGITKNPFKLIKLLSIINNDKRNFIFEYELLSFANIVELLLLVFLYPFKILRVMQKEDTNKGNIFNYSLIDDMRYFNFDVLTRYILGKNIAKLNNINKIYSWSEFQVIERSFNYGVRSNNSDIRLIACQFYLNYETYFNAYIDDIDYDMLSSPNEVLVNGKYYLLERKKVKYKTGLSLRYNNIFKFDKTIEEKNILLLGSYIENDTKYMLDSVSSLENIIFKNHPAVDISRLGKIPNNIMVTNENIYKLFESTKLVIGTASGTSLEAVACGLSVIIIASQDNLTANPLVDYGKGEIWDIAFDKDDVEKVYNRLIKYRKSNIDNIQNIASWYKDNFFVEPNEENIIKVFELKKE